MEKYLRSIGLLKEIRVHTRLTKVEVVRRLNSLIGDSKPFATSEGKNNKKVYTGEVGDHEFEFRRKMGFLGLDYDSEAMVKVQGSFDDTSDGLIINAKVIAQTRQSMIIYMCVPVFGLMIATVWESSTTSIPQMVIIATIFAIIAGIQIMRLRMGISKMSKGAELELRNLLQG